MCTLQRTLKGGLFFLSSMLLFHTNNALPEILPATSNSAESEPTASQQMPPSIGATEDLPDARVLQPRFAFETSNDKIAQALNRLLASYSQHLNEDSSESVALARDLLERSRTEGTRMILEQLKRIDPYDSSTHAALFLLLGEFASPESIAAAKDILLRPAPVNPNLEAQDEMVRVISLNHIAQHAAVDHLAAREAMLSALRLEMAGIKRLAVRSYLGTAKDRRTAQVQMLEILPPTQRYLLYE